MISNWQPSASTDCGLKRKENQDYHYISPDKRLLIVADGDLENGAAAGKLAVETIAQSFTEIIKDGCDSCRIHDGLIEAIARANEAIWSFNNTKTKNGIAAVVVAYCEELEQIHIELYWEAEGLRPLGWADSLSISPSYLSLSIVFAALVLASTAAWLLR